MPTRFDHAVIAVRDLEAASAVYRRLGFDVQPGGRHEDGGTYNALIRFGLDYLELLAVFDEQLARSAGRLLFREHDPHDAALVGYALATETLDEEMTHFRADQPKSAQPRAMGRQRPDGQRLTWRVYTPDGNGMALRQPWPFLIQWDTPDQERLGIDRPGSHANGALGWSGVAVAVKDLEVAREVYGHQLGLSLVGEAVDAAQIARRVTFELNKSRIDVLAPQGDGPLQEILQENGEGPFALTLEVRDLNQTIAFLERHHFAFVQEKNCLTLAPNATQGVRLVLTTRF